MWNCVPLGMAQTKPVAPGRAQDIAVPTFKPDHVFELRGEMGRV
jgi:hypothetical protein